MTSAATLDPTKVSPSRLNGYVSCGIAFRLRYLDKLPAERSGSAALRGSVMHAALEAWAPDRTQDLLTLVRAAWVEETKIDGKPSSVTQFLKEYAGISTMAIRAEHEARVAWELRNPGKVSKNPRMTREFKQHPVAGMISVLLRKWLPKLQDSYWRFTDRDPLPAIYDESLVWARRYQARWGHLPPAVHTEFELNEPWRGFTLNGYVDEIELLLDRWTQELLGIAAIDYKSYAKPPAEFKDWRQVTMYDAAIRSMVARGALALPVDLETTPLYVGVDYLRWDESWKYPEGHEKAGEPFPSRVFWKVGPGDYERLERELNAYKAGVENDVYLPAEKGRNPEFCDYPGQCCLRHCAAAGGDSETVEVNL